MPPHSPNEHKDDLRRGAHVRARPHGLETTRRLVLADAEEYPGSRAGKNLVGNWAETES
jgi:hypothetical protein